MQDPVTFKFGHPGSLTSIAKVKSEYIKRFPDHYIFYICFTSQTYWKMNKKIYTFLSFA